MDSDGDSNESTNTNPRMEDDEPDLDEKYPNRPRNHSSTLPFHVLFQSLFNPLSEIKKKPAGAGPGPARKKVGPHGLSSANLNPVEKRRDVIERFISRWRTAVGDDIYPAFRLILPDKDRDRAMYGIKEKAIGKLLIRIMKIDKNSEDALNLLNWKLPGQTTTSSMAGDFAGRCYEVLSKRPMRTEVGDMTIEDVNEKLDQLSAASKEDQQLQILMEFYRRMNPEELMWLIRIILRQMKVGATERTFFDVWHPDAENLYSTSSSLRRVCWELHDPNIRLEAEDRGITLMQCFQPQLAQFQMHSLDRMVSRMKPTEDDPVFWIEEKLDGERMQLHMMSNDSVPGRRTFRFWSRKAKDYTYLYGNGIYDENGALTRYLKDAFADGVESLILDGEMITWDTEQDAIAPFGTLKTAAISEQRNPYSSTTRPLFRIFDILYLNGRDLTRYTLRDRRNALQKTIKPVHRRFEIHSYEEATGKTEVEEALRRVVEEASEGLVIKNPRSPYRLNERHDDWMKVKPEYMTEFGESLDVIVIGGYYGSGHRGGSLSSFLCGLRVDDTHSSQGGAATKCYSFCKVGGGFTAADYANIRHHTDGKWHEWNPKKPPTTYIELAGGDAQHERPDMWIKPEDSVVLCVKAASVAVSDMFRIGLTLRFPRFKRLRMDKDWKSALSVQEFLDLKANAEQERKEKEFNVDNSRKKRAKRDTKKPLVIAGNNANAEAQYVEPSGHIFDGLNFYITTDSNAPVKKSKAELEQLVKANGGKFFQTNHAAPNTICVADRRTVKAASLQKSGNVDIIRPSWILDCIRQNEIDGGLPNFLLPLEPRHIFFATEDKKEEIASSVDRFQDSYARNTTSDELREILKQMGKDDPFDISQHPEVARKLIERIQEKVNAGWEMPSGWLFKGLTILFAENDQVDDTESEETTQAHQPYRLHLARNTARFAGANVVNSPKSLSVTHIVVAPTSTSSDISSIRKSYSPESGKKVPHLVTVEWIEECWKQHTLLDEEGFQPPRGA
ncbi:DNA ligase 4 [Aspergillus coremiiformis]|uniref:DNA ligase n=1 Tax=Aspergillus coremiiformis TaxID=138285 RepID=A0A5N6Z812_9EURO|nr:DNA ligase 4 [Aspergillus coremiiformis]